MKLNRLKFFLSLHAMPIKSNKKKTAVAVSLMLTRFLLEVTSLVYVSGFTASRIASKTLNTPNTFENRNLIRYNLSIFPRIF